MGEKAHEKKIAELKEKIASFDLFSPDTQVRERGISMLPKETQKQTREFVKRSVNSMRLVSILIMDLGRASAGLRENYHDQFWRRTSIRALAATVEGIIYTLKDMAHASAEINGVSLSAEDNKFLLERKALVHGEKPKFLPFKDNLKHTFNLYAKHSGFQCPVSFNDDGFTSLCETFFLRDQTMHPKSYETFSISTEQTKRAGKAIDWLNAAISNLMGAHNQKLTDNIEQQLEEDTGGH